MLIGGIILLPIMLLAVYPEESVYASCFTIPGVTAILTGYVMSLFIRGRDKRRLIGHQDALIVVFSWLLAILFCSVPFMLTGKYNFTQSVFECTSGWSTTGLSVVNVEDCPKIFCCSAAGNALFRRSGSGSCDDFGSVGPARNEALLCGRTYGPACAEPGKVGKDDNRYLYGIYYFRNLTLHIFWNELV